MYIIEWPKNLSLSPFSGCVFNICDSSSGYWSEERKDFVGLAVIGKQVAEQSCKIPIDLFSFFLVDQVIGNKDSVRPVQIDLVSLLKVIWRFGCTLVGRVSVSCLVGFLDFIR